MVSAAVGTAVGNRYRDNYDTAHLRRRPLLAVVSDGMGAGPGSAFASRTAVQLVAAARDVDGVVAAVAEAHAKAHAFGERGGFLSGCTLTALVESGGAHWVVQVGDSRLYRLRGGLLELLTVDHTMAWLGAVHGWYAHDSAEAERARYHLTRYVGHPAHPAPDVLRLDLVRGDVLLLCTDGVAEQVDYHDLHRVLGSGGEPRSQVDALLAAASAAGGRDNATAVVVHA
ncbi:PP2C family protein-serine/threonine phosphatase [Actinokineospora bangkokensis]|uniref:Protein phosphatase n=1 Tax=Actinokineospora bangkokensis TaxID=1193682 RepID=A0A1Q9LLF2_9PSEU|nr:protein phosphatase 2C domain-containing protein [Actinokineospora bangkokensis]OLR92823.1 protein phosphatase [Actinokineospora bangkokensis]